MTETGTNADFYVGVGADAEWLGSVTYDGYEWDTAKDPSAVHHPIHQASTTAQYIRAVRDALVLRGAHEDSDGVRDAFLAEHGWPWSRRDSLDTPYVYAWVAGRVQVWDHTGPQMDLYEEVWPDMRDQQRRRL